MKYLGRYYFVRFIIIIGSISVIHTDFNIKSYLSMISDIHSYYATSSVFFVTGDPIHRAVEYTFYHALSREFSKKRVMSLIVDTNHIEERLSRYNDRLLSPLIVVFMKTPRNVEVFSSVTRKINLAHPIWLLIFTDKFDKNMCDYCTNASKNTIPLHFDTELLVSCCRDPELKLWWSLHENKTEESIFGTWTENDGYVFPHNKNLYAMRNEINGTELRIAVLKRGTSEDMSNSDPLGTFFYLVLKELQRVMNFKISSIVPSLTFGSWCSSTKTWSGVVSQIIEGKADIAVAELSMTTKRLDAVDFTLPLVTGHQQLYIRIPAGSGVQWSAHFQAFEFNVWATIIVLIVTTPLLMTVIQIKSGHKWTANLIFENYLCVCGIFCQQGLCYEPVEMSLRIAGFSLCISSLVMCAAYSAALISFLAAPTPTLPIRNFRDLIKDTSYKLIVLRNSSEYDFITTTNNSVLKKIAQNLEPMRFMPVTVTEAFRRVCAEKAVFFSSEVSVNLMPSKIPCSVTAITTGRVDNMAMILPRHSQFTALVNYHIQRFQDRGMLNHLKKTYLMKNLYSLEDPRKPVTLSGIAPILLVLFAGIILAFLIFLCEKLFHSLINSIRKYRRVNSRRKKVQKWSNFPKNQRRAQLNLYNYSKNGARHFVTLHSIRS